MSALASSGAVNGALSRVSISTRIVILVSAAVGVMTAMAGSVWFGQRQMEAANRDLARTERGHRRHPCRRGGIGTPVQHGARLSG